MNPYRSYFGRNRASSRLSDYLSDKTKDDGMGNVLLNDKESQKQESEEQDS